MRFVIIGGGPAGNQAATHAARLGVDVTLIERDIVGGAANLWDCVPSKAMIASGGAMSYLRRISGMGVVGAEGTIELELLRQRIQKITDQLEHTNEEILESQGVELVRGTARLADATTVIASTTDGERSFDADAILIRQGAGPACPTGRRWTETGSSARGMPIRRKCSLTTWWSSVQASPASSSSTCSRRWDAR